MIGLGSREYNHPEDATIGASYICFDGVDTAKAMFGYDGTVRVSASYDDKRIVVDDFTARPLPFRPLSPPFFNCTKNIFYIKIVIKEYQTGGSVPVFFLLDESRIVRNVFNGYGEKTTSQAILDAIKSINR